MNPQCQYCGKFVALKTGQTTEFAVKEEFRKEHSGTPRKMYLCGKCKKEKGLVKRLKQTPWYDGHRII